jgi:hypothetical protein
MSETVVDSEAKRIAYNEYMKVWRANHKEQLNKEALAKYHRGQLRKRIAIMKDIDSSKYTPEQLDEIHKYLVLLKDIKEKYPELL